MAENVVPSSSPQEAAVSRLPGPALGSSLELSHQFSKWSVASERYFKSECQLEGSARCGRVVTGQLVLGLCAGQMVGGSARYGTWLVQVWPNPSTIPVSDQDPTRILHDDLWSRRLRGVELFSIVVVTGHGA